MSGLALLRKSMSNPAWLTRDLAVKAMTGAPAEAEISSALLNKLRNVPVSPEEAFLLQRNVNRLRLPSEAPPPEMTQQRLPGFQAGGRVNDLEGTWHKLKQVLASPNLTAEERSKYQSMLADVEAELDRRSQSTPNPVSQVIRTTPQNPTGKAKGGLATMKECRCHG